MNKYGFIKPEVQPQDYIFGDAQIDAPLLQPTGQWDEFLPTPETQNTQGFEPYACASFGTDNCIEVLLKRKFNFNENYSDRYLAKMTGTDKLHGNDPHKVAEFLRHSGNVSEYEWPMLNITSFDDYYRTPPANLAVSAKTFTDHYELKHDYVPNDPKSMMNALRYSPLGISVYAWTQLDNGLYAAGDERSQNHWVMCYGYEEGKAWHIFDSYDNTHKKLEWKHRPAVVKRYHIELAPQTISWLKAIFNALSAWLKASQTPQTAPETTPPPAPPPPPPRYDFSTYKAARHSVRLICDEEMLSLYDKEVICACIKQESNFDNRAVAPNKDETGNIWSRDYGICQINDYWSIGPNKPFPSVQFVVDNPEKCVRFMVKMMKAGKLNLWSSYKSGAYLKYMP